MNNTEYYLNREEYGEHTCSCKNDNHLNVNNCLSEFRSEEAKEEARLNLGIPDIIEELNAKIDNKVIDRGDISWDLKPTLGNFDKVLSSNVIYLTLLKYALKKEVDHHIQEIWLNTRRELAKLYNKVECELNQINLSIRDDMRDLECSLSNGMLENKIAVLEQAIESLARTKNGVIISDTLGSNSYSTMSQRAITNAITKLWDKIELMTGETILGITMTVTPEYFFRGKDQLVNIKAISSSASGFDSIKFYVNGELIGQDVNTDFFETNITISDTTEIECVATILGIEYRKTKIIECVDNFFLLAGQFESDEDIMNTAFSTRDYSIPITETLRVVQDVLCNDGDRIIIIVPKVLSNKFLRADMDGHEIPFDIHEVNNYHLDGNNYVIYISKNQYLNRTYNIDING